MVGIYFSGTGNSKYALTRFMKNLGEENLYSMEEIDSNAIKESDEIVFAYPIQFSNLPKIVRDFIINNKDLWKGKRIYIIITMGMFSGDGAGLSARLFKKYKAKIKGGLHVRMPDSVGDVKTLKKELEVNKQIVEKANIKIDDASMRYNKRPTKNGLSIFSRILGFFGQRLYFGGRVKNYTNDPKVSDKCSGCGICAKICPMQNIKIVDGKAESSNRCTRCYRCFSNCPNMAITILGKEVLEQVKIEKYL